MTDDDLISAVHPAALRLIGIVRDEGREAVEEILWPLSQQELYGLVILLAAMVPDDQPPSELLAWTHGLESAA